MVQKSSARYQKASAAVTLLLLCALLFFTFFLYLSRNPLNIWDEGRRAADALYMYLNNEWLITFYDNNPNTWSTKSPLLLWLQVFSLKLFGINEWAIRFPSALAACTIGIVVWYFCKRYLQNVWIGLLAGSVFAGTYAWVINHAGRSGDYDALLTLFSITYCFCFFAYCVQQQNKWLRFFWLFVTLAVFTKGVAGLFFLPGLFLFALIEKKLIPLLSNRWLYLGALFFALFIGSYYAIREYIAPGFLKAVYGNELGGRYLNGIEGNGFPFHYYFKNMVLWRYDYWTPFLLLAFIYGLYSKLDRVKKITLFNLVLTIPFLLIISISKTKLYWYDLPVYPFFSLQIGLLFFGAWQQFQQLFLHRFNVAIQLVMASFLFMLFFYIPYRRIETHNNYVYQVASWEFNITETMPARFLKDAIETGKNLNNHIFYYAGPSAHLKFYITKLQTQKVQVQLKDSLDALQAGTRVVVCQPELIPELAKRYAIKKETVQYDCCTVFLVEGTTEKETALPAVQQHRTAAGIND